MADALKVGDTVECTMTFPFKHVVYMTLQKPAAVAHAQKLVDDEASGWRRTPPAGDAPTTTTKEQTP